MSLSALLALGVFALLIAFLMGVAPIRRGLVSRPLFAAYKKALPRMSDTEREALEAGTVWWEGELFRGRPDWNRLLSYQQPRLTPAEQSFLDHEVEEACRLADDWRITHELGDLPPEVWRFIKDRGFFGLIIPRRYGGLEFSAYAHSQVVTKLSTRCSALSISVMVPNSLGPAELLLRYGTEAQKDYFLPRLAKGQELPAFALTSPWAGSDAAAIPDCGIVCRGWWQGREVLGMRVTWDKRYITLAPVCTLLGLAFRLFDPDDLLGRGKNIGITCALVPHDHPGVEIGRRHFPLDAAFMNGPTRGRDVFMPLDFIVGGPEMAGQGWRMLMECLAAGRAISLPSSSAGMAQMTARAVGGYARVRSQFKTPVGRFEGVEEALARIGANTYMVDAARTMTVGAVDLGEKPPVASAIVKYHATERSRQAINDGMDVIGGKGICLGPANFLGRVYQQIPIAITVEGANILTRSLIVFGQGAIRCHPYVLPEMRAAGAADSRRGLADFDRALWSHAAYFIRNGVRAVFIALSGARFVEIPKGVAAECVPYYRQVSRLSSAFAFLSEVSMLLLGGSLKRREKLSARLGDILAQMYLISAVLKRYEAEGRQQADAPLLHWAILDALQKIRQAFRGLFANFPHRLTGVLLGRLLFPWGYPEVAPSDRLGQQVARLLIAPSPTRDRLTAECYLPKTPDEPLGAIELALRATLAAEPIEARISEAEKAGRFAGNPLANVRDIALAAKACGVITAAEFEIVARRNALRDMACRVDDFPFDSGDVAFGDLVERRKAA